MDGARSIAVAALRRGLKSGAATIVEAVGGRERLARIGSGSAPRVLIFAWHRIVPDFERMAAVKLPGLFTSVTTFDRQLAFLCRNYRPALLDEALLALSGERPAAEDLFVVTFDDGYADFLEHAVPVLQKHRLLATTFVPSGLLDSGLPLLHDRLHHLLGLARRRRLLPATLPASDELRLALAAASGGTEIEVLERLLRDEPRHRCLAIAEALEAQLGEPPDAALAGSRLLSWEELRAVAALGHVVGGHTLSHACLPNESPAEIARQLRSDRDGLSQRLKVEVRDFAYPNGWWSPGVIRALKQAGYRSGLTTEDRSNVPGQNPFLLRRKCVWERTSHGLFGYAPAVSACNFAGVFTATGLSPWVPGERPDVLGGGEEPEASGAATGSTAC